MTPLRFPAVATDIELCKIASPSDAFARAITPGRNGCYIWTGNRVRGYGKFYWEGRHWRAHRASYRWFVGEIPPGSVVCHRCDTPACVNPEHLFVGSQGDNLRDRDAKGRNGHTRKQTCPRGHPYDEQNTYHHKGRRARTCRTCAAARSRMAYARRAGIRV
jgi:hypothetical protein